MLAAFEIHEPATVEEAAAMLDRFGDEAAVYAGGTELVLIMKEGLARYGHLINIKTIPGLDAIALSADAAALHLGPLATHARLARDPLVRQHAPLLAEMEAQIANLRVRAAGTLGGNLCFAEPHSDPATLLLAWGATLELHGANGRREVPAEAFFLGLFETARQAGEILVGVRVPRLPVGMAGAYERFVLHERPTATLVALLRLQDGRIEDARIAVGSVGPVALRVAEAEQMLLGERPAPAVFAAAAERVYRAADPVDDIYGSASYKRHLARVLAQRALQTAASRATGAFGDN
jgi:aerobic carbon-monoxide dehydrogenase medium subunit